MSQALQPAHRIGAVVGAAAAAAAAAATALVGAITGDAAAYKPRTGVISEAYY